MSLFGRLTLLSQSRSAVTAASRALLHSSPARLASGRSWNLTRLNHVAIVVPDLKASSDLFSKVFGAKVSPPEDLPEHGVTTVFVELDNCKLELLHPLGEDSPVANFLAKNKAGGIHHICVETDNIAGAIADLPKHKVRPLGGEAKTGAHGYPVVFLHPKDVNGVLTELEQPDEEWKKRHAK